MAKPSFKVNLTKVPQYIPSSKALETHPHNLSGLCLPMDSSDPNPLLVKAIDGGGIMKLVQPDNGREVLMAVQPFDFVQRANKFEPTSDISQQEFGELQKLAKSVTAEEFATGKANADLLQKEVSEQVNIRTRQNTVYRATSAIPTNAVPAEMRQPYLLLPASHLKQFQNINFTPLSEVLHRLRRTHQEAVTQPRVLSICGANTFPTSSASTSINRRRPDILEQLEAFAKNFRRSRIELGFSQYDFCATMRQLYGVVVSQTTVSRFEALNLTIRNMRRLRPTLERWLEDVERAAREEEGGSVEAAADEGEEKRVEIRGTGRHDPLMVRVRVAWPDGGQPPKPRRKRTLLDERSQAVLEAVFEKTAMPSHDKITALAAQLEQSRNVVRAWFCNRRFRVRRMRDFKSGRTTSGILNLASSELGLNS